MFWRRRRLSLDPPLQRTNTHAHHFLALAIAASMGDVLEKEAPVLTRLICWMADKYLVGCVCVRACVGVCVRVCVRARKCVFDKVIE